MPTSQEEQVRASLLQQKLEDLRRDGYAVDSGKFLQKGWQLFKSDPGIFIGFFLLYIVGLLLATVILHLFPLLGKPAVFLIQAVAPAFLNAGFFTVALKKLRGEKTVFSDFLNGFNYFFPLFLFGLLSTLLISLGLLLLIIPGIYLGVSFTFAVFLIIEGKMDFWAAMTGSLKVVGANWFSIFLFLLVIFLINLAGALCFGIGLLISVPLSACAVSVAYEAIFNLKDFFGGDDKNAEADEIKSSGGQEI